MRKRLRQRENRMFFLGKFVSQTRGEIRRAYWLRTGDDCFPFSWYKCRCFANNMCRCVLFSLKQNSENPKLRCEQRCDFKIALVYYLSVYMWNMFDVANHKGKKLECVWMLSCGKNVCRLGNPAARLEDSWGFKTVKAVITSKCYSFKPWRTQKVSWFFECIKCSEY